MQIAEFNLCKQKRVTCAVQTCQNNSENNPHLIYHPFPKECGRSMLWVKIAGCNELLFKYYDSLHLTHTICEQHFESKMYGITKKHLLNTAVPTIDVPNPQFAVEAQEAAEVFAEQLENRGRKRVNKCARTQIETVYVHGNNDSQQLLVPEETSETGKPKNIRNTDINSEISNIRTEPEENIHLDTGTVEKMLPTAAQNSGKVMYHHVTQKNVTNTDSTAETSKMRTELEENIFFRDAGTVQKILPIAAKNSGKIIYEQIIPKNVGNTDRKTETSNIRTKRIENIILQDNGTVIKMLPIAAKNSGKVMYVNIAPTNITNTDSKTETSKIRTKRIENINLQDTGTVLKMLPIAAKNSRKVIYQQITPKNILNTDRKIETSKIQTKQLENIIMQDTGTVLKILPIAALNSGKVIYHQVTPKTIKNAGTSKILTKQLENIIMQDTGTVLKILPIAALNSGKVIYHQVTPKTIKNAGTSKILTKQLENIILQDTGTVQKIPIAQKNSEKVMNHHEILQKENRDNSEPINPEAIQIIIYANPKTQLNRSDPLTLNGEPKIQIIPTTNSNMILNTAIQFSYDKICRMCLSACKNVNSIHDFVWPSKMKIIDLLALHVKPETLLEEYIPDKICQSCVKQLVSFHKFKEKSEKCESFLKSFHESGVLQNVKIPGGGNEQVNMKLLFGQSQHLCTSTPATPMVFNTIVLSPRNDEMNDNTINKPKNSKETAHINVGNVLVDLPSISTSPNNLDTVERHTEKATNDHQKTPDGFGTLEKNKPKQKTADTKRKTNSENVTNNQPIIKKTRKSIRSETHASKRSGNYLRFCGSCRETFATLKLLDAHIKETNHSRIRKNFSCGTCDTSFTTKEELRKHVKKEKHTLRRRVACPHCGELISTTTLRGHIARIHLGIKSYCCEVCGKQFKTYQHLRRHEVVHTMARPYSCDVCGCHFGMQETLRVHKKIHQEGEYECTKCNAIFNVEYDYYHHSRSHLKKSKVAYRPNNCEICGKIFTTRSSIGFHMLTNHEKDVDKSKKSHKCSECEEVFLSGPSLNVHTICFHKKPVNNRSEIKCAICNRYFESLKKLHSHKRMVHYRDMKYCKICEQGFDSVYKLYKHQTEVHFPHRLEKCNICDRKFLTSQKLEMHIRTHTGEKPFKCDYCDKSFSVPSNLVEHTRRHTKEKPYKCEYCDEAFYVSSTRRKHQEKVHSLESRDVDGSIVEMELYELPDSNTSSLSTG